MADWTYLIADLRTNITLDELPLSDVQMSKVINGSGQFKGKLTLGDSKLSTRNVYDLTRPVRRVVYAVRDSRPWWGGIIWASTYDDDDKTVTIAAADFWSYFDHRKVLEALPAPPIATSYVAGLSKIYTAQDQNVIARGLVTLAQSHTAGDIGIVVDGGVVSGIARDRTYNGFELVDVGEALRNLANLSDGPDILFDVAGPGADGRPIRIMRTGTPALGQQGSEHRFDLGGNLLSFTWDSGGGSMASRAFAEGNGTDRGTKIAVAEDTTWYANGYPLLETDDVFSDVVLDATLNSHASDMAQGSLPTVGIDLKLRTDMDPEIGDFGVGDDALMVIPLGHEFFPAGYSLVVRILSIDVTVSSEGQETCVVSCIPSQEVP